MREADEGMRAMMRHLDTRKRAAILRDVDRTMRALREIRRALSDEQATSHPEGSSESGSGSTQNAT